MKKILLLFVISVLALSVLFINHSRNQVYEVKNAELIDFVSKEGDFGSAKFLLNNQNVIYSFHKVYSEPDSRGNVSLKEGQIYNLKIRKNGFLRPDNEIIKLNRGGR